MSKKDLKNIQEVKKEVVEFRLKQANERKNDFEDGQIDNPDRLNDNAAGLYAKGITHNPGNGVADIAEIKKITLALDTTSQADFDSIDKSGARKQVNPQAALSCEVSGADPEGVTMAVCPALDSREAAGEMVEVYEKGLARDISWTVLSGETAGTPAEEAQLTRAVDNLNAFGADFKGPKIGGQVTRKCLFRGLGENELVGPYISQLMIHDVPIGAHTITQQSLTKTGDYGITQANWMSIQQGDVPVAQTTGASLYNFSPRVLGSFVHIDFVYQAHLYAAAMLLGNGASLQDGYLVQDKEDGFITNGGPAGLAASVGEISRHALKAAWVQKWKRHMRLRPEAMAGRVVKLMGSVHPDLLSSSTIDAVKAYNNAAGGDNEAWLPLQFAEGSPTHPSYPAGHAAIAGACSTILKLYFADSAWSSLSGLSPSESVDGLAITAYAGGDASQMSVHGELNKLASNMSIGRNFAGVHYRSDGDDGMLLGEKVAVQWFKDNIAAQNEDLGTVKIKSFDGVTDIEVKS